MMRISECTAADNDSFCDTLFSYLQKVFYVSSKQIFTRVFAPRYWLTWFGVGVLWLLVQLPYPVLRFLGTRTGKLARPFLKRRESIAQKNIELCFPTLSREEREKLIAENFHSLGMALLETGMAWFWPDSRVRKWFDVDGLDNLTRAQAQNRGVMVVGVHFMSLGVGRPGNGSLPADDGDLSSA
ncbi:Protein Ddg [Salmonella enterica subsp. enterica]|nr:Protein Ddg [Salmonella enterica subsp. enterica]